MMTDLELATAFFKRIQKKGFNLEFNHHAYGLVEDLTEPHPVVIELASIENKSFCSFDFHADGSFYRISGYTAGYYQDEVDGNKY